MTTTPIYALDEYQRDYRQTLRLSRNMEQLHGSQSCPSYTRDEVYYFQDVVFLVEDTLFRVPRRNFEMESDTFGGMFTLVQPEQSTTEGSSDDDPIYLEGYSKVDFQRFLRVLLPLRIGQVDLSTSDEWISVLKLSHIWEFDTIKGLAIQALDKFDLDPVDKTVLARDYDIPGWLLLTFNAIAQRGRGLDMSDLERLGIDWVLRLARVRESVHEQPCITCRPGQGIFGTVTQAPAPSRCRPRYDFTQKIRDEFGSLIPS
ncbi:hypothetical protein JAAARDRAFT_27659 [Jaapia argillacea MUCL 33604]|uniref:BTB domain-containing protein n=1 Tax=Jaapia argillacea MUCL 33604 TaxID=933084 RepID=A0A067QMZ7_9AGAM|nr:hypothetical protein JAAARDRAFT_27659 [Jaapia argillacea MUCL 33604]